MIDHETESALWLYGQLCLENGTYAHLGSRRRSFCYHHANSHSNTLPSLLSIQGPLITCLITYPFSYHFATTHFHQARRWENRHVNTGRTCADWKSYCLRYLRSYFKSSFLSVPCLDISGHRTIKHAQSPAEPIAVPSSLHNFETVYIFGRSIVALIPRVESPPQTNAPLPPLLLLWAKPPLPVLKTNLPLPQL